MTTDFVQGPIGYKPVLSDYSVGEFQTVTILLDSDAMSDPADFSFSASANGGTSWEAVTVNTKYTFMTTGDELWVKITGQPGAVLTLGSEPLRVQYTKG